jgi:hypothetical protein
MTGPRWLVDGGLNALSDSDGSRPRCPRRLRCGQDVGRARVGQLVHVDPCQATRDAGTLDRRLMSPAVRQTHHAWTQAGNNLDKHDYLSDARRDAGVLAVGETKSGHAQNRAENLALCDG